MKLQSASQDKSLEQAASFIIKHRQNKKKIISIIAKDFDQLNWLSDKWFNFVTDNKRQTEKIINFGRLTANTVILHVVANMTNVINAMKME